MTGEKMKVLIFDSTALNQAPYMDYYKQVLVNKNIDYKICTWDKYSDGEPIIENNIITIRMKWHKGKRKYYDFFRVASQLQTIIEKGQYTHLVLVNTVWAMLLRRLLLNKFSGKYVIDIRDYKCELAPGYKFFLKKLIDKSFFTTISSGGFRSFLPNSKKIIPNHNITNVENSFVIPTLFPYKKNVRIGFLGYIRYREENEMIIRHISKEKRFSLYYGGVYAKSCPINEDSRLEFSNITYGGSFQNQEKVILYKDIDMIHSVYGSNDIARSTLLPNRLYDAIIFKKPMLVSPNTYLSNIIEKYDLGISIDLYDENFIKKLSDYIDSFSSEKFICGANRYMKQVVDEQELFKKNIQLFFGE